MVENRIPKEKQRHGKEAEEEKTFIKGLGFCLTWTCFHVLIYPYYFRNLNNFPIEVAMEKRIKYCP